MDQLLTVLDDHGNLTRATYDLAGRMRLLDNPDAGQVETVYDAASNVTRKITSNLRASSKAITYDYEFTRLTAIHYPNFPENDVAYQYGSPAQLGQPGNLVGRITQVTDASGSEVRAYDALGQLVEETKTVASHTQGNGDNSPEIWTTHYLYDTWGRLQQMTYPDGEVRSRVTAESSLREALVFLRDEQRCRRHPRLLVTWAHILARYVQRSFVEARGIGETPTA